MKTISSRNQYLEEQLAGIIDSLIFGHLQTKQYTKTLHALLLESPHLTKDATTVQNAPNQIILNVNSFLHDRNLEQIIETFYTYGRFDVPPNLLELAKRLRELSNEFSSELAFGCHAYSNNEQRFYGRKTRSRAQQNPVMFVEQPPFNNQHANKHPEFSREPMTEAANEPVHNDAAAMQYSHAMDIGETRAEDLSVHENAHSRRKAAQPLKQSQRNALPFQRAILPLVKMSNENLRDKEAGIDNSSLYADTLLESGNFDEIFKGVVDDETLYEALESVERDEAMEADMNSRDSMNMCGGNGASFALDIPMHDDHILPSTSALPQYSHQPSAFPSHPHNAFSVPPAPHNTTISMNQCGPRPLMEQYIQHPANMNHVDTQAHNAASMPPAPPPPPPPPPIHVESLSRSALVEPEKKPLKDTRDASWTRDGSSPSQLKTRLPPPSLAPSTSTAVLPPRVSSLGRIPKKGQSSAPSAPPLSAVSSPAVSPQAEKTVVVVEKMPLSKGKIAPTLNGKDGKRDSLDSQDTLRAESVADSDCTVTENEDELPVRREVHRMERKNNWDDLFDDSPATVAESNRERERREKELQENKRRLEMRELEKKREREKRRKDKEKKDDDRREKPKDDRSRYEKRPNEDRRRDSTSRDDREDKEREDRQRKRKEQEEQKKIIDAQKRQMEIEERVRQKKKEEEDKKREEEKRREREKEMKKIEEEKLRKEKDIKSKEEKRNELERRRRREAQLKKNVDKPPLPIGDSPLDKIAAEMDGKELRKENEVETNTRASSRVMEISSGLERNRPSSMLGSLHSSKSGIFLDKAQKLRDTTERQQPVMTRPSRPIRPNRVQMAPMKRPTVMADDDDEDEEDEGEGETPAHKKGRLEDNAIDSILNKIYR